MNITRDCFQNFILYKGFCIKLCPRKFYNNLLELDTPEQIKSLLKNQTCSPCHYTCLSCKGSLDSDCTECYNDAEIVIPSTTESYCYPVGIVSEVLSEKWYHRVFTMMYVLIILAIIPTLLYLWIRKRRNDNKKKLNYLIAQNIERENIKTTAYSDDRP